MTYSFLRITSFYKDYLKFFYQNYSYNNKKYQEIKSSIYQDCFAQSNFYEKYLQALGVSVDSVILNDAILQHQWAKENNLKITKYWQKEILYAQIKKFKPEVLYFDDHIFSGEEISRLKSDFSFIKLIIGFCCSPFKNLFSVLGKYDFLLTCTPCFVKEFKKYNIKSYLMYHAFEPEILKNVSANWEDREIDLCFIGQFNPTQDFHKQRIKLLNQLLDQDVNLALFGNLPKISKKGFIRQLIYYSILFPSKLDFVRKIINNSDIFCSIINEYQEKKKLITPIFKQKLLPSIYGLAMFDKLANTKIGLNSHIDISGCCAGNIRLFEVTGMGTLLLTDKKENMKDLFVEGKEVVLYESFDDAMEKIKWLLDNPQKMKEIALAGQKKTLAEHNYQKRVQFLHRLILRKLI
ncbi:MAG: glycosyltransferase [Candidatus Margulisiibacteriota bacterium]|jgi:hypothetical protein